ncbi:MAG TPA: Hsp70 family protein, partial [Syntrophales bacterium]|nr:Hsp70 family protein [Syntrophales bacterium]
RNHADALVYSVEKNLKEFGDKIDAGERSRIEDAVKKLKDAMNRDDLQAIQSAQEELTQASHKLAEAMYAKASAQQGPGPDAGAGQAGPKPEGPGKGDDDVVDADFEEVK